MHEDHHKKSTIFLSILTIEFYRITITANSIYVRQQEKSQTPFYTPKNVLLFTGSSRPRQRSIATTATSHPGRVQRSSPIPSQRAD